MKCTENKAKYKYSFNAKVSSSFLDKTFYLWYVFTQPLCNMKDLWLKDNFLKKSAGGLHLEFSFF